jgi:VWFA-related protein
MNPDLSLLPPQQAHNRRHFWAKLFAASGATLALPILAQTVLVPAPNASAVPSKDLIFSTGVRVVNILATVRDKRDQIVHGLTKEDFLLKEADRPHEIQYFGLQSDLPLTIGLLIDLSSSMWGLIDEEKVDGREFLAQILRAQDQAFLVSFGSQVWLNQPLTFLRADLDRAIVALGRDSAGGTKLFDAVKGASDQILRLQQGRKAMIVLSDGDDTASKFKISSAIEAAQRADVLVYTLQRAVGDRKGTDVWKKMAAETGGHHFKFNRKPLANTFAEIEEELRNQYLLGFEPEGTATGFRSIKLTAKDKSLRVQARTRYFAE